MAENHGGGIVFEGLDDHLAGIHRGSVNAAGEQDVEAQHTVARVETEQGKHLVVVGCELQFQVGCGIGGGYQHLAALEVTLVQQLQGLGDQRILTGALGQCGIERVDQVQGSVHGQFLVRDGAPPEGVPRAGLGV
ncbi:hypothetical protein D3C76_1013780 [compost metagenome]